jgi:regulatory protein
MMTDPKSIKELIDDLVPPAEVDSATDPLAVRRKAMDYLARREYAAGELSTKLGRAGFDPGLAAATVDALSAEGLQSDERFLEAYLHTRVRQGKGPLRIRAELSERGIAAGAVEAALAGCDEDWSALACAVRARKFGDRPPVEFMEKARQVRFLHYRGFETEQVRAALGEERD